MLFERPIDEGPAGGRLGIRSGDLADRVVDGLVTVVLSATEHGERLGPLITSLLGSLDDCFEVLVVDDAGDRGATAQLVRARSALDPRVRSVVEPLPGRARARNTGLRFSRGGIVAFVDAGCVPDRTWVAAVRQGLAAHPNATFLLGRAVVAEPASAPARPAADAPAASTATGGADPSVRSHQLGRQTDREDLTAFLRGDFGSTRTLAVQKANLPDLWSFDVALGPGTPSGEGDDVDAVLGGLLERWSVVTQPAAVVRVDAGHVATAGNLGALLVKRGLVGRQAALVRRAILDAWEPPSDGSPAGRGSARAGELRAGAAGYVRARVRNSWTSA